MRRDRCAPAHPRNVERAEVVIMEPTIATELRFGCSVEGIETYPQAVGVRSLDQSAQPVHLCRGPFSCVWLAASLDHLPRIVPPAPVVRGFAWIQDIRRRRGLLTLSMNSAEEQYSIAGLQLIVEHGLLRVWFSGQYQNGFHIQRLD